jgi:midasin
MKSLNNAINLEYPNAFLDQLREMVKINVPCVVYGNSGKIEFLKSAYPEIKVYDSREISEPKSLGGFYAIKEAEIQYIRGILADAMLNGHYICFKKIDTNINLLQFLRPVIGERKIVCNDGKTICAHPNFRIFFTSETEFELRNVAFIGKIEFTHDQIYNTFGNSKDTIVKLVEYIHSNKNDKCLKASGVDCELICHKDESKCECNTQPYICSRHFRMLCSLKEFMAKNMQDSNSSILDSNNNRLLIYQAIANIYLKHDAKILQEMLFLNVAPLVLPNMLFAKTEPVESTLKALILNIENKIPTLLVGETGAGKTALIQYLCSNSEHFFNKKTRLEILNMSSDFDGTDLIGGYHSIDFDKKIKELYLKAKLDMPKFTNKKQLLENLLNKSNGQIKNEIKLYIKILDKKAPFFYKEGILVEAMKNGTWILLDEINLCSEETLSLIEAILSKDEIILFERGDLTPIKVHENFMIFACMNPFGDFGKKKYESQVFNKLWFYDFSTKLKCIKSVILSVSRNTLEQVEEIANFYYEFKKNLSSRQYSNIIEPLITGRTLCRAINLIMSLGKDKFAVYNAFNLLFFTQLDLNSRSLALSLFKKHIKTPIPTISDDSDSCESYNNFIVTPKVKMHLKDVELGIRSNLPILLQGDTSTGKTSLILALANKYNKKVLRVNNHEHTESGDYIGNYITTKEGIQFREGVLITAMRKGYWIILDELNLAPSDVLEVLNRLLDDNKELYVQELEETIKPHPEFRLFATQNINYSGRQGLAKSFRNRFVEIFFYEKDENEIKEILEKRCKLPPSFIKYMMGVFSILKVERTVNNLITLRDLFKWAKRGPTSYYELFEIGMDIIISRQRSLEDKNKVAAVFSNIFQDRMALEKKDYMVLYYGLKQSYSFLSPVNKDSLETATTEKTGNYLRQFNDLYFNKITKGLVLTKSYIKLIDLIYKAWANQEPVLLIGETGIGKTKICEIVAALFKISLRTINMHSGTESSDFIGHSMLEECQIRWKDGPLTIAMKQGEALLIDEINLAEDSVLERMNSILEDKRTLFITETGQEILAHDNFRVVSTMNPSGDFGKRELSPALRNRFTEIYFELDQSEYTEIFDSMVEKAHSAEEHNLEHLAKESVDYYKQEFRKLGNLSIRKVELVVSHIKNIKEFKDELISVYPIEEKEKIWSEALEVLGISNCTQYEYLEDETRFGVYPYYLQKKDSVNFTFNSNTAKLNLQRIIRGLSLGKGILLEGEPGVGKTSIITSIAKSIKIPILRINLSEQTEMSDLIGTYLPIGDSIKFIESEMVEYMRQGYWIILDEINLCTQSVIEGLNSILDHRRRLDINGNDLHVHENTRIFGTMNPYNDRNGRKRLPKSFLDRFIIIKMEMYSRADIEVILSNRYGNNYILRDDLSLRGNIKKNELNYSSQGRMSEHKDHSLIEYCVENGQFMLGDVKLKYDCLDESFVLVHSQLKQLEMVLKCIEKKIPVILCGEIGTSPMIRFISKMLGLGICVVDCHKETDNCDLLGQYQKSEGSENNLFEWKDSYFIESLKKETLVVFNTPELVEKSVFDRLNSIFESERYINIYEKGIDTKVYINERCRFVLRCDHPALLSPALVDRCEIVYVDSNYSYLDLYKIFHPLRHEKSGDVSKRFCYASENEIFRDFESICYAPEAININLDVKRHIAYDKYIPHYLNKRLRIYNAIKEEDIDELFKVALKGEIDYNREVLAAYKDISKYSSKIPKNYKEKIELLEKSLILPSLIKSLEFGENHKSCKDAPSNIQEFKFAFLENLKDRKIGEYSDLAYFTERVTLLGEIENLEYNECLFSSILRDQDPLLLVRAEAANERISKENAVLLKIFSTAKDIYKYGTGNMEPLIKEYDEITDYYSALIMGIDKKLTRDYSKFRSILSTLKFCDYYNDPHLRSFLEDFSDLFSYFLINLFNNRENCRKCAKRSHEGQEFSLRLIRHNEIAKYNSHEYAKYVFNMKMGYKNSPYALLLESIFLKDSYSFSQEEINGCIRDLFPEKTLPQAIESRTNKILLGKDFLKIEMIDEQIKALNIFTSPEKIVEQLQIIEIENESKMQLDNLNIAKESKKAAEELKRDLIKDGLSTRNYSNNPELKSNDMQKMQELRKNELLEFLRNCYKKENVLSFEKNYKYFLYFLHNEITVAGMEKFFMSATMYEFLDRMYFAECFLSLNHSNLLYNVILQFKAFELENSHKKKLKETKIKLYKSPHQFEDIIFGYVNRFMYIPVLSMIKITFEAPKCQQQHLLGGPKFLLNISVVKNTDNMCECTHWISLAKKFKRDEINSQLSTNLTKEEILKKFYGRTPSFLKCSAGNSSLASGLNEGSHIKFSYDEICYAKVLNTLINNMNAGKYDEPSYKSCISLLEFGLDYLFAPFLYFVYKFGDSFETDEQTEEGVGLKDGEGENNMKDNIKEEDIMDEFDKDQNDNVDSEGVDMDNEGEMHSVSNESEGDSGVDDSENSGEKEEEEDINQRGGVEDKEVIEDQEEEIETEEENEIEGQGEENEENASEEAAEQEETAQDNSQENSGDEEDGETTGEDAECDENEAQEDNMKLEYKYKEAPLNKNQTCQSADSYDRKVEGSNLEEKDALKEGEGEELIEGEGETGTGLSYEKTVTFTEQSSDCTKLTNLLRTILESNKNSKYKGDYKSGKRLNLKKIVPYIASDYRRDKIWMKRQKNDKKNYVLRIFIDNSRSMFDQAMVDMLSAVYYKISQSFALLSIPVQLYKFGTSLQECQISDLTFNDDNTFINWTDDFTDGINIILTDGVFQNVGHYKPNFLVVMIDKGNVKKMSKVSLIENKVYVEKYLDTFALKYCVVENINDLELVFVEALANIIKTLY